MDDFEFLKRFEKGEKFSERELSIMPWEMNVVDTVYGENGRWTRPVQTIFEVQGRLFALDWDEGLTESQDHEFDLQPYEVEKRTKTIVVNEYIRRNNQRNMDNDN